MHDCLSQLNENINHFYNNIQERNLISILSNFSNSDNCNIIDKIYTLSGINDQYVNIESFSLSNLDTNSTILSIPIISIDYNQKICSSINKLSFPIGPICPHYYSRPIEINLISFLNEKIHPKIKINSNPFDNSINILSKKNGLIQLLIYLPKDNITEGDKDKIIDLDILLSKISNDKPDVKIKFEI